MRQRGRETQRGRGGEISLEQKTEKTELIIKRDGLGRERGGGGGGGAGRERQGIQ